MFKKIPVALLFATLAGPIWGQTGSVIKDIRVEGVQRTDAGTVFNYLPIKVGDRVDEAAASAAIKALFATGFFKDVRIEIQDDVLIVSIQERPTIAQLTFVGNKEFDTETVKKALKDVGLAESRIFDRSLLERAEQELKRQYITRGKYGAKVTTTVTPLERNRVAINFTMAEGEVAKIAQIRIVGNQLFPEKTLLDLLTLTTPGWFTWYTKNDQYSKPKLQGDLEALKSFYQNQGYLEFNVDSTQVAITPDKQDIYITLNITEGPQYQVADLKLSGELLLPENELRKLILLQSGEVFSQEKLIASTKLISDRLGNEGYAFANVNAVPDLDKEKRRIGFTFVVDPGRRIYVRRINISGNTRTKDEVIRRELRQLEGGWYDLSKINRSKVRLERLDYFKEINVETPAVPGASDQVDLEVTVTEKPTGSLTFGAGFSSGEGLVLNGSVSQANIFGTGNSLDTSINTSKVNRRIELSFTDPYWTVDGISRGFSLSQRNVDPTEINSVAEYKSSTTSAGLRFSVPISETDNVNFGVATERTHISLLDASPLRYRDFIKDFGEKTTSVIASAGWARDTRDSLFYPTKGRLHSIGAEVGLPGTDLQYYRINYQNQWFIPVSQYFTLMFNAEVGFANGLRGRPLPFFKNYYAGGVSSVRGYDTSSLGPRDEKGNFLGGKQRIVGNAELLFPIPGLTKEKSVRGSLFFDMGRIRGDSRQSSATLVSTDTSASKDDTTIATVAAPNANLESFRYSAGIAVAWQSPMGPLKFSFAYPIARKEGDKIQRFQFQFGKIF